MDKNNKKRKKKETEKIVSQLLWALKALLLFSINHCITRKLLFTWLILKN